jgi:DNA-binding response OmpR family regulator
MKRILVIEDEARLRRVLVDFLRSEGYEVTVATDGATGLQLATVSQPHIIVLDVMLPNVNGFDVCRSIRSSGINTPVLIITAKGEETDKVLGLELGADDYITKPFGLRELHARIRARLRNVPNAPPPIGERLAIGAAVIDFKRHCIVLDGIERALSALEASILKCLIERRGEVVSREELLNKVWGYDSFPTTRTVDTHLLNLRKKLEPHPNQPRYLITVHGVGYKFSA